MKKVDVKQIAKVFGLDVDEEFNIGTGEQKTSSVYKFSSDGLMVRPRKCLSRAWAPSNMSINDIIKKGITKIPWVPTKHELYYYPSFELSMGVDSKYCHGDDKDERIKRIAGCYKTKEKALEKAIELGWHSKAVPIPERDTEREDWI